MTDEKDESAPAHEGGVDKFQQLAKRASKELHEEKVEQAREVEPNPHLIRLKKFLMIGAPIGGGISLAYLLYLGSAVVVPDTEAANQVEAEKLVRSIAAAQETFLREGYGDANQDGVPDYGDFLALADPAGDGSVAGLIPEELADTGEAHGYFYSVHVVTSEGAESPSMFYVVAHPIDDGSMSARSLYVDTTGKITFEEPNEESFISEVEID